MRILVALGGNALLKREETADAVTQRGHVEEAATQIARIALDHEVVLTHGNGPQVGLLALQSEAYPDVAPYPLDVLGAESEGMIGYLLELGLRNALPDRELVTVLTQVFVSKDDPAFMKPSKPVGPVFKAADAKRLAAERDWTVGPDGDHFRRLVASPEPHAIVELASLRLLLDAGTLVICAGGGGIPVTVNGDGKLRGVEAVIDKDRTSALLARRLGADLLVMLTDVDAVETAWGTPDAAAIAATTPSQLAKLHLAPGSMGPKVRAGCGFVQATGSRAAIGSLADAVEIVTGDAGTQVHPDTQREPAFQDPHRNGN